MILIDEISKKFLHHKEDSFKQYFADAKKRCQEIQVLIKELQNEEHSYSIDIARNELGLDEELIKSLIDDFVKQIITAIPQFKLLLQKVKNEKNPDFMELKNLAHKNLGVARNLRIKDAQTVLSLIMKETDIDKLKIYLEYLEACVVILRPKIAYEIKQTL